MWFTTSGRQIDLVNFVPQDADIETIAHALSNICRFGGHVPEFYSVAQHSVIVAQQGGWIAGLLHDAHEAFTGDRVRPLKNVVGPSYHDELDQRIQDAIERNFSLSAFDREFIKYLDNRTLATEARDLLDLDWRHIAVPFDFKITPLPPKEAKALFLETYHVLVK